MEWFKTLRNGTYIEMGGLDGITYSNSWVFNKALAWSGVLIELIDSNYEKLEKNRQNEIATVHAGVCAAPETLHYYMPPGSGFEVVGGIYEFTAPSFRDVYWKGISLDDPRVKQIECDTLDSLLNKYAPGTAYFDFFSLDVEGAEFSVLESIDYERVQFGIVFVEADSHNELKNLAMKQLLTRNGYDFLEEYERSYWFVNSDFYHIYRHLIYEDHLNKTDKV